MPVYCSHCTRLLLYLLPLLPLQPLSRLCLCVVFDRHMFLMLCGCHVDILGGLACISHLCGSACFVCFNYYGRPPVVISHFEGTFKMPLLVWYALLHRKDSSLGGGVFRVYFCQAAVKLWTHWLILFFLGFRCPSHMYLQTAYIHESHCSVCVCSKHTVVLSKPRLLTHKVLSCFSRLYTHSGSQCFWNISWLFYSPPTKLHCKAHLLSDKEKENVSLNGTVVSLFWLRLNHQSYYHESKAAV